MRGDGPTLNAARWAWAGYVYGYVERWLIG